MNTKALRQKVLDLAIHGKLVPQNPNDESAIVLLEKIRAEKAEKIKKGELKAEKKDSFIFTSDCEFANGKLGKCSEGTRHKRHYEQFADGTVKDIEDEIPFEVPEGWAWCRLGVLSETTDYIANSSFADTKANVKFYKDKNYALLVKTQDFNNNFTEDLTYTDEKGYDFLSKSHLFGGELLLSNIGASIGKALIVPKFDIPMAVAPNSIVVRTTNLLETQFLKSVMLSTYGQSALVKFTAGSAMPKFNKTQLRSLLIPLPPISAQQSIISTINTIFETIQVIENDKGELENLIKHTKSKILDLAIHGKLVPQDTNDEPAEELLKRIATSDNRPYKKFEYEGPYEIPSNWSWCYLSDVCSKIKRGKSPKYIDKSTIMAFAQKCNKKDGPTSLEKALYIDESTLKKYSEEEKMQFNDIVINSTGTGTLGRVGIFNCKIPSDVVAVYPDSHITTVRIIPELNKIYFYYFIKIRQNYLESMGEGSTNQKELKTKTVNNIAVPRPPLAEQQRIVSKIEELFKQLDIIQNEIGV